MIKSILRYISDFVLNVLNKLKKNTLNKQDAQNEENNQNEHNKHLPDAIVYCDANGKITHLTEKDFTSRKEFEKWKAWSDADYAEIEKGSRQYNDHIVPLFDQDSPTQSAEDYFFGVSEREEAETMQEIILSAFLQTLTPIQERRFLLYYGEGMTLQEIAESEGVGFQRIAESLELCKKKILKFKCKYSVKTGGKNGSFSVLSERENKPLPILDNFIDSVKGTKPV